MGRAILLLAGLEIGGGWLLVSTFELAPTLAYGVMAGIPVLLAIFILLKVWSRSD